ncbi:MAG: aminoacyl-tRNA hydrolase [wastewater metagenome]|nr:aminoacyl-tRNA hydrolase [Candidatus Loosdrechtia aerotolerans]
MIYITRNIVIDEREIQLDFIRSPGPGGQNVNKVATSVQLRFDVKNSSSLPEDIRNRLTQSAGKKITKDGILIIRAQRFRSQEKNRQDAVDRLINLIRKAAEKPKHRRRTQPTIAAKKRQLETKYHRSKIKKIRRSIPHYED